MNLFHLVKTDAGKRSVALMPSSPARIVGKSFNRSKSSMSPDLCETSDLSTDTDDFSREEQLSVNAKLNRAKRRREKASKRLETVLNDKNEQAFQRAQKTIAKRKEQSRKNNKKVKRVKERHSLQEKRRRSSALRSIENRVNGALTRAEANLKKRQGRERKAKRIEKVKSRRALIEFERRSALLESLGHRSERAARNLQLRLEDLQGKARDEIKHAHVIAKRVKAARVIQKSVRAKLGFSSTSGPSQATLNAAAVKLQSSLSWRTQVVSSRLAKNDGIKSLQSFIAAIMDESSVLSFEEITALITNGESIDMLNFLIASFDPVLRNPSNSTISARTLLSSFLVSTQPDEVLAEKRGKDECSILLEKTALKLVTLLHRFSKFEVPQDIPFTLLQEISSKIVSYCALFNQWKSADLNELVEKMTKSAFQSWVAYLSAKEALAYIEEKSVDQNVHFQHLLKHKSSKKGAASHIKRVRAAMKKILGDKQSALAMSGARTKAVAHIKDENLMVPIKAEIDSAINAFVETSDDGMTSTDESGQRNMIPENIQSNTKLVHQLLLMDGEDLDELVKLGSKNFSYLDNVETFMFQLKNHTASQWIEDSSTVQGIKRLIIDLMQKMCKLVPNRKDLHNHFTSDHVEDCKNMHDFFALVLDMAAVMAKALESENNAIATKEWYDVTSAWLATNNDSARMPFDFNSWESYLIASLSFLIGKADLCQMEIVNFQLVHVAPIVQANGKEYETQHFQRKYGDFSSVRSMENFSATWNWIRKICDKGCVEDLPMKLRKGFTDDILFAKEAIEIPEVLNLDVQNIHSIRDRARIGVISATLLLVAGKVTNLNRSSLSTESKYYKEKIDALLSSRLPLEIMVKEVADSLTVFATKMSGTSLTKFQIDTLSNSTYSILQGNDPVFGLMDKRMQSLFQMAATFRFDQSLSHVPTEMKSGRQLHTMQTQKRHKFKDQFMTVIGREASKLGFSVDQDKIVQAAYEAHKVVSHCIDLYGEVLLCPMMKILEENP